MNLLGRISDECKNVGVDGKIRIAISFDSDELEELVREWEAARG